MHKTYNYYNSIQIMYNNFKYAYCNKIIIIVFKLCYNNLKYEQNLQLL